VGAATEKLREPKTIYFAHKIQINFLTGQYNTIPFREAPPWSSTWQVDRPTMKITVSHPPTDGNTGCQLRSQ